MSRPVNLPLNTSQQVVNFGVSRNGGTSSSISQARFVDMPRRTAVTQGVFVGTGHQQLTIGQIQSDTIYVNPGSGIAGTANTDYYLPSASDLIHAFSDLQIGKSMRLWVVNNGTNTATFFGMTGQGASTGAGFSVSATSYPEPFSGQPAAYVAPGPRALIISMNQINGSNTGGTFSVPPVGSTGAYSIW
jgi:hypothetical protein